MILTPKSTPPSCPAVLDPQRTLLKGYQPYQNPQLHHTYPALPQPSTLPNLPSPTATLHPTQPYHTPQLPPTHPALPQPSTVPNLPSRTATLHPTTPQLPSPTTTLNSTTPTQPLHSCSVSLSHSLSFSSHIFVDSVCIPFLLFITFYC